jgi:hypothetical protein
MNSVWTELSRVVMPHLPLDVLELEPMASGHRSLRLTRAVEWDGFPPYAEALVRALDGTIDHRADGPDERVWSVTIGGRSYWLSLDDYGLGVALDSCDAEADAGIEAIRSRLLERAGGGET